MIEMMISSSRVYISKSDIVVVLIIIYILSNEDRIRIVKYIEKYGGKCGGKRRGRYWMGLLKEGVGGLGVGGTLQLYIYNTEVNIVTTM